MKCPKCKNNVPFGSKFCPICGEVMGERTIPQVKINVFLIVSCVVLMIGIACFMKLNFFADELFAGSSFLNSIQLYVCGIVPLVFLIISFVLSIIARAQKSMKIGCTIVMIIALVMMIGASVLFAVNIVKEVKVKQLLNKEISDENIEELQNYYEGLKTQSERDEFVQKILKEVEGIKENYLEEKIDVQTAENGLNQLEKLQIVYNDINDAKTLISQIEASRSAYSKAKQYEANSDYIKAISSYAEVIIQDEKNYEDAQNKITEITSTYKNSVIQKANQLADNQQYQEAMNVLIEAENTIGTYEELENVKSNIENQYVDAVLAEIQNLKNQGQYSEAMRVLNEALLVVDSSRFRDESQELEKYQDASFATIKVIDSSSISLWDVITDLFGNSYSDAYRFRGNGYIYFNTNGYYRMFGATVAAIDEMDFQNLDGEYNTYRFEIYADNQLVYTSPDLIKTSQPLDIDVDINYAKVVQIKTIGLIKNLSPKGVFGNGKFYN